MSYPVPGPPASVLAAILREDPEHPYNASDATQRRYAYFAASAAPVLQSLVTEQVFMPGYGFLDANVQTSGYLSTAGLTGAITPSRWVGATSGGPPATGAFLTGDYVIDATGAIWVCTDGGEPGTWVSPAGLSNPMNTPGDLIIGGTGGAPARLPQGSDGQVLGISGGTVGWVSNPAGFVNPMTTAGDTIIGSTGGAAGRLPAGAAGQILTVVAGAPAWTSQPSTFVFPTGDSSGAADTALIQGLLTAAASAPGTVVQLGTGTFHTNAPLQIGQGTILAGLSPVAAGAGSANNDSYGTVIKPVSSWSNPGMLTNPGVLYMSPGPGSNSSVRRPVIQNLWIDGTLVPGSATCHGIVSFGNVSHALISHVGVWGVPGTGLYVSQDPNTMNAGNADGWVVEDVMLQSYGGNGVDFNGQDSEFSLVHAQAAGGSTVSGQIGWYLRKANNCRLIGCRSDQNGDSGFVIDSNPGGSPVAVGNALAMTACGTERNFNYGLKIINSSGSGNPLVRNPVTAGNCSFGFDGRGNANGAGIYVQGINTVDLMGCYVTTAGLNSGNYPEYGLVTASPGVPQWINAVGGVWNCNNASAAYLDGAGAGTSLHLNIGAVLGSPWVAGSTVTHVTLH